MGAGEECLDDGAGSQRPASLSLATTGDVVAFLASDQARWVTGQNLRANGGVI
jgi:NAD(P)-dependent dehydrogenase (short-subunit alcohol dehydrogenase family)